MSERRENSVLFSLNELKRIEEDRVRREDDERKRREDEEKRRREEEDRRRREDEQRRMADEAARRAREDAERKAEEEHGKLQIEMAADAARREVERKAALERARLEAEKAGRRFDADAFNAGIAQPHTMSGMTKALIGAGAVAMLGLAGGVVYLVTKPPEVKEVVKEKTVIKPVETEKVIVVTAAPTDSDDGAGTDDGDAKKPRKPRVAVKKDGDDKPATAKPKTKISKDPLEGLEL